MESSIAPRLADAEGLQLARLPQPRSRQGNLPAKTTDCPQFSGDGALFLSTRSGCNLAAAPDSVHSHRHCRLNALSPSPRRWPQPRASRPVSSARSDHGARSSAGSVPTCCCSTPIRWQTLKRRGASPAWSWAVGGCPQRCSSECGRRWRGWPPAPVDLRACSVEATRRL